MSPQQANDNSLEDEVASLTKMADAFQSTVVNDDAPPATLSPHMYKELSNSIAAEPTSMRMLQQTPPSQLSQLSQLSQPPPASTPATTSATPLAAPHATPVTPPAVAPPAATPATYLPASTQIEPTAPPAFSASSVPPPTMPQLTPRFEKTKPKKTKNEAALPSPLESYTRRMRKSAYLAQLLGLQADNSQSRAMSSLLRDAVLQENGVLEKTSRPWIPGLDLIGKTTDMYEGKYISTAMTPNTRVIHDPTEGDMYKKYQIPSALQVVEKGTMTSDGIWTMDYVTDTMRLRVAKGWGYPSPGVGEMQISDDVQSQSEAFVGGAVSGTASSEKEYYALSFQKDWGTEVISGVLGSGMKTRESDEEMRRRLLRDGGGESASEGKMGAGNTGSSNNYGPATKVSELLLDMVCGGSIPETGKPSVSTTTTTTTSSEEEEEDSPTSDEIPIVRFACSFYFLLLFFSCSCLCSYSYLFLSCQRPDTCIYIISCLSCLSCLSC
jgi:hypothetical protein